MENDINQALKEEMEKLRKKYEELSDELMSNEAQAGRLKEMSNQIWNEIEDNKKQKRDIEISLQRVSENMQQLNLS